MSKSREFSLRWFVFRMVALIIIVQAVIHEITQFAGLSTFSTNFFNCCNCAIFWPGT